MQNELEGTKIDPSDVFVQKADKWSFLRSTRFWAMILGAVTVYLNQIGVIGEAEMQLIATITAGFIAVKTVDKFHD